MRKVLLPVLFLVFFNIRSFAATAAIGKTKIWYGSGTCNLCLNSNYPGEIFSSSCWGAGNVCIYSPGYFDSKTCTDADANDCGCCERRCDPYDCKPSRSTQCTYTYSNPSGTNPFANGIPSGTRVSSDVMSDVNPATPTVFPANPSRKYIQLDWKPIPNWGLITVQGLTFPGQGVVWLPGDGTNEPNRFRVDFQKLKCGTYSWYVHSHCTKSGDVGRHCNDIAACNPVSKFTYGPSFTKACCDVPPTISNPTPANNYVYPASTSQVTLGWRVYMSCDPYTGSYHRAKVGPLGSALQTLPINPTPPLATGNYSPTYDIGFNRCSDSTGTGATAYSWHVETGTINGSGTITQTRLPTGTGEFRFSVAPNVVQSSGPTIGACYTADTAINLVYPMTDYNLLDDTFRFVIKDTSGNVVLEKDVIQSSTNTLCPSAGFGSTVSCTLTINAGELPIGDYTIEPLYSSTSCPGVELPVTSSGTIDPLSTSLSIGDDVEGTMTIDQDPNSEFRIVLTTTSIPYTPTLKVQYYKHLLSDPASEVCPSDLGAYSPQGSPVSCSPDVLGVKCESVPFLPVDAGRYCFRAIVSGTECATSVRPDLLADVYLINTYMQRYIASSNVCQNGSTPTGEEINGVRVNFRHDLMDSSRDDFFGDTSGGVVTFAFWLPAGAGSPHVSEVTATTTCSNCIEEAPCLTPYVECGGDSVSDVYAPGVKGELTFITTMTLIQGGNPVPPAVYNIHMRMGRSLTPDDWLTTTSGDVYAPGFEPSDCSHTSLDGTIFDGALMERSEGTPYEKDQNLDGSDDGPDPVTNPFTGGYIYSPANIDGNFVERLSSSEPDEYPVFYLAEPDPIGRYAFNVTGFADTRFSRMKLDFDGTDYSHMVDLSALPGVGLLQSGKAYQTDDISALDTLINNGGYELAGNGAAVIYYHGNDPINFDNATGFRNLGASNGKSLVIITDQDVNISNTIGYKCWFNDVSGEYGCSKDGYETGADYSPDLIGFPANIDATIVTFGFIDVVAFDSPIDPETNIADARLLKVKGSLIAHGNDLNPDPDSDDAIKFGRKLGELSTDYPSETIHYDYNLLYNITRLDRSSGGESVSGLTKSVSTFNYGY